MSRQSETIRRAIRDHISVPPHIAFVADAIARDLTYGPAWVILPGGDVEALTDDCDVYYLRADAEEDCEEGDKIVSAYGKTMTGALRDFIDNLPSTLYVDTDAGYATESEPESQWSEMVMQEDEEGNEYEEEVWHDEDMSNWFECDWRDIVAALFGDTIAREFR